MDFFAGTILFIFLSIVYFLPIASLLKYEAEHTLVAFLVQFLVPPVAALIAALLANLLGSRDPDRWFFLIGIILILVAWVASMSYAISQRITK